MEKERFSNDFRAARARTGMSLEECGRSLGVTGSAVGNWENPEHKSFPRYERWGGISKLLGLNPQDYVVEVRGISVSGNRSEGNIVASNAATVNVGGKSQ